MTTRPALALSILFVACSSEAPPPPPPPPAPAPLVTGGPTTIPGAAAMGVASIAGCAGTSVDPPGGVIEAVGQLSATNRELAVTQLMAIATQFPLSATARIRLAGVLLHAEPTRAAESTPVYLEALRLHEGGCRISENDEWALVEGMALAFMFQNRFGEAVPWLQRGAARWPTSGSTRYNLACSLCRTGDVAGCYREFEATLTVASTQAPPAFLAPHARPASHYANLSRTDPDLEPLRADPRWAALVARY